MFVLLILCLLFGCLIVVPLLLVGLVLKLAFGLILLPFRLAGLALRLALGLVFALLGLLMLGGMLLIPLLPVIALVAAIWLLLRIARRRPLAHLATD